MKKFLSLIFIIFLFLAGCNNQNIKKNENDINQSNNYTASKTGIVNSASEKNNNENESTNTNNEQSKEENLSSFSTKIYTPNDEARQNNIRLTCSKLNETIVKPRRNFFILQYCWKSHS